MKTVTLVLGILILVGVVSFASAQAWRDDGYDKVEWLGTTVDDVKKAYPNLEELHSDFSRDGRKVLQQKSPNKEIRTRAFGFNRNMLYRVEVIYADKSYYKRYASKLPTSESLRRRGCFIADSLTNTINYFVDCSYLYSDLFWNKTTLFRKIHEAKRLFGISAENIKQFYPKMKLIENIDKNNNLGTSDYVDTLIKYTYHGQKPIVDEKIGLQFSFYHDTLYQIEVTCQSRGGFRGEIVDPFLKTENKQNGVLYEQLKIEFKKAKPKPESQIYSGGKTRIDIAWNANDIRIVYTNPIILKKTQQALAAQGVTPPCLGYDNVEWGMSVNDVTSRVNLTELPEDDYFFGVRSFLKPDTGRGIVGRFFSFYKDKLYRVDVVYTNITRDLMVEKLKLLYGDDLYDNSCIGVRHDIAFTNKKTATLVGEYEISTTVRYQDAKASYIDENIESQKRELKKKQAEDEKRKRLDNLGR